MTRIYITHTADCTRRAHGHQNTRQLKNKHCKRKKINTYSHHMQTEMEMG